MLLKLHTTVIMAKLKVSVILCNLHPFSLVLYKLFKFSLALYNSVCMKCLSWLKNLVRDKFLNYYHIKNFGEFIFQLNSTN